MWHTTKLFPRSNIYTTRLLVRPNRERGQNVFAGSNTRIKIFHGSCTLPIFKVGSKTKSFSNRTHGQNHSFCGRQHTTQPFSGRTHDKNLSQVEPTTKIIQGRTHNQNHLRSHRQPKSFKVAHTTKNLASSGRTHDQNLSQVAHTTKIIFKWRTRATKR